jgi:PhzF family phenazine biosynthesis protein
MLQIVLLCKLYWMVMNQDLRFLQLDVFTERAGGGNPLGVVFGAHGWNTAQMQDFARWTDLVETTFVLAPTIANASYRLRIFSPSKEIPFAGHPTIGSAHAVLQTNFARLDAQQCLIQECQVGLLPIRAELNAGKQELFVAAPSAQILKSGIDAHPILGNILQSVGTGGLPPAFVDGGRRWWVAEIESEVALRAWKPDHASIGLLAKSTESMGLCAFARSDDPHYQLVVRAFPAGVGIVEDPASGAANGLLAAFIQASEPSSDLACGYTVSQGREIGHNATLKIRFEQDAARTVVWVGGQTHTVIDGHLHWKI